MARNFGQGFGQGILNVARAISPVEERRQAGLEGTEANRKKLMLELLTTSAKNLPPNDPRQGEILQAIDKLGFGDFSSDAGSLIVGKPSKVDGSFGNSIQGRSQQIMMDTQAKINSNAQLSGFEKMQREFATANITAPRDTVQVDPVTGEKSIVTIRPEMPKMFLSESSLAPTSKEPRIKKTIIDAEPFTKKSRIAAQKTLKSMTRARQSMQRLLTTVAKNPSVTGVRGMGKRIASGVGGQIGLPADTTATSFATQLEAVRSDLRVLIDEGRFSDEDRKRLENLVKGTGVLDSPQDTIASYTEVIKLIEGKIDSANETLGNLPRGVTEASIRHTMKLHNLTRKQVLEKVRARRSSGR